jgi:[citrate (pro-3S)-lyase] ligase
VITLSEVNLNDDNEIKRVSSFLESLNIKFETNADYSVVYKKDGKILASASKSKNILKCFGVDKSLQGENITSVLLTALINKLFDENIFHYFLLAKKGKEDIFTSLGFKLLYSGELSSLLESGIGNIEEALTRMKTKFNISGENSAVVVNCNPFTKGHRYLIEQAAKKSKNLLIFVVEEDKSVFPFKDRYEMIRWGTADIKNISVVPGGEYIISAASFPSYFLKKKEDKVLNEAQIDAGIFGKYFCSKFNIKDRYVGEEPLDYVTNEYNKALLSELYKFGVDLHIIKRLRIKDTLISASKVRSLIKEDKIGEALNLLPESTIDFLTSSGGREVIKKIKGE